MIGFLLSLSQPQDIRLNLERFNWHFFNSYTGVKTISKESFPHGTYFSKNFVGH